MHTGRSVCHSGTCLSSPDQTQLHRDGCTQYFWDWSPTLSTQAESREGGSTSQKKMVWPPPEQSHQHCYCLRFPDSETECPFYPGVPGGHLFTSHPRILFVSHPSLFYCITPSWSPNSLPAPHLCYSLCLTPLKLAHHCNNTYCTILKYMIIMSSIL